MKAIINGKRYDTKTAELVLEWNNGCNYGDFQYRSKDLYRTKNGAWFIEHEGGAMTDMAKSCGSNNFCGSKEIEAISAEDAYRFLCSHDGADEAEEYFADKIQEA